jgi:hypothetical protein
VQPAPWVSSDGALLVGSGLPSQVASKKGLLQEQLCYWLAMYNPSTSTSAGGPKAADTPAEERMLSAVARYYWIWWPGHGNSEQALMELLRLADKRVASGGQELSIRVPPPSLLLHMPALVNKGVLAKAAASDVA